MPAPVAVRGGSRTVIGLTCLWGAPRKEGLWSRWGSHGFVEGENLGPNWSLGETLSIKKGIAPQKKAGRWGGGLRGRSGNQDQDRHAWIADSAPARTSPLGTMGSEASGVRVTDPDQYREESLALLHQWDPRHPHPFPAQHSLDI